ncbi:MAG: cyclic nucleotide-binding domain-containing protein [Geminicoccaceae bacterium]
MSRTGADTVCLGAIAAVVALTKVLLYARGSSYFIDTAGADALAPLYIYLGLATVLVAWPLDRLLRSLQPLSLLAWFLVVTAALALAVGVLIDRAPVAGATALLALAHLFDIVTDVIFWVAAALFLAAFDLRARTVALYAAISLGGAAGGLLAAGSAVMTITAMLALVACIALISALAVLLAQRLLLPQGEADADDDDEAAARTPIWRIVRRFPLAGLLALNSLLLTLVYGLTEYLCFHIYEHRFVDEADLTRFVGALLATIQLVELALLAAIAGPALNVLGPLQRSVLFPLTSAASLAALVAAPGLGTAVAAHVNTEAVSNALFEPANTANYNALPARMHGAIRSLADVVFYPLGLAIAGIYLLSQADAGSPGAIEGMALVCAMLFVAVNLVLGSLFMPTLLRNLRAGILATADLGATLAMLPAARLDEIEHLIERATSLERPKLYAVLARALDSRHLLQILKHLKLNDASSRRAVLAALATSPARRLRRRLLRTLARTETLPALGLLAGQLAFVEPAMRPARRLRLCQAHARSEQMADLLTNTRAPPRPTRLVDPTTSLGAGAAHAAPIDDALDVLDVIDPKPWRDLLLDIAQAAPSTQRLRALACLARIDPLPAAAIRLAEAAVDSQARHAVVVGLRLLARCAPEDHQLGAALAALARSERDVREAAMHALACWGAPAIPGLCAALASPLRRHREAAFLVLARAQTPAARQALAQRLAMIARQAEACAQLRGALADPASDPPAADLRLVLDDVATRLVRQLELWLHAAGADTLAQRLHAAMTSSNHRLRSSTLEALVSSRHRKALAPWRPLLIAWLSEGRTARRRRDDPAIARLIVQIDDPWLSSAYARLRRRQAGQCAWPDARAPSTLIEETAMDQVMLLKQMPLFRHLPLDALLALSGVMDERVFLEGERLNEDGARADHLLILARGRIAISRSSDGTEIPFSAPKCLGELALIEEGRRWSTCTALEDGVLYRLHRIVFEDLAEDYPIVFRELARLLAERVRVAEGFLRKEEDDDDLS